MSKSPIYLDVFKKIKSEIDLDNYKIGDLLPPEPELCKMFNVSRTTIRKAIEMLESQGYVNVQQGRGTEVLDFKISQSLNKVTSLSETLTAKGYDVSIGSIHISKEVASDDVAEKLLLSKGSNVTRVQRIQLANNVPIGILDNYIISDLVPGLEDTSGKFVSLYKFLESEYGIEITSSFDTIGACVADFIISKLIDIPVGSPMLVNKRVTYSYDRPIEYVTMTVDASKYEFSTYLEGR
ncbi:MAG: GntR family transcriptional regulator [Peptostreptococcaceae bacterium]